MRKFSTLFFILYLFLGLYFINYPFQFISIPESFASVDKWIIFVGGILVILGAINHYRVGRYRHPY